MDKSLTKEMAFEQNKANQTAFVIVGSIGKIEIDKEVGFNVTAMFPTQETFGSWVTEKTIAWFMKFPLAVSHKILQNKNRRVKITIELTDDEDFI